MAIDYEKLKYILNCTCGTQSIMKKCFDISIFDDLPRDPRYR